jgi:hypothetical protein
MYFIYSLPFPPILLVTIKEVRDSFKGKYKKELEDQKPPFPTPNMRRGAVFPRYPPRTQRSPSFPPSPGQNIRWKERGGLLPLSFPGEANINVCSEIWNNFLVSFALFFFFLFSVLLATIYPRYNSQRKRFFFR